MKKIRLFTVLRILIIGIAFLVAGIFYLLELRQTKSQAILLETEGLLTESYALSVSEAPVSCTCGVTLPTTDLTGSDRSQIPAASASAQSETAAPSPSTQHQDLSEGVMVASEAGTIISESGLVNLNTATKEELMTLPGIGESRAEAIIRYREECGAFAYPEELMNVSGIKEASFRKLADLITI